MKRSPSPQNVELFSSDKSVIFRPDKNGTWKRTKIKRRGRPLDYHKDRPSTSTERSARAYKRQLIHHKSQSVEWETDQDVFDAYDAIYHFTTDVCADASNAKCVQYFTRAQNGLKQRWTGVCWMNPPYGRKDHIERWVQKAYESSLWGTLMVCLLPVYTGNTWWQEWVKPLSKEDLIFLPGRQKFSRKDAAPFNSAVVIFRPPL